MRLRTKKSIDDVLAAELSKLGGFLAGWTSRRLPNSIGETRISIAASPAEILAVASSYFTQHGRILEQDEAEVSGVVGGGRRNLNPVHVTVQVGSVSEGQTPLFVRTVAKEGVSKQYAGETTAPLVAEYIVGALAP